jgi:hypothetical protein
MSCRAAPKPITPACNFWLSPSPTEALRAVELARDLGCPAPGHRRQQSQCNFAPDNGRSPSTYLYKWDNDGGGTQRDSGVINASCLPTHCTWI